MDQRLRLQAEVRDNASPKLRQIGKELKEIRRSPGMEQAQQWFTGFNETAGDFVKSGGGVAGTMGAIGIGGLTAATSLALLVKQFKDLGDHTFAIKRLGQETGLTIDQIKQWEYVGNVFRIPTEQLDASLKTFGEKMVDFKRHRGELFGQLNQLDPGEASKLLGMKDADAQFHEVLRWLSTIKDAAQRNKWAREYFGTDDLDALLTNGLPAMEAALAKARLKVAPVSPEMLQQADKLAASIIDLNQAWENFELKTGPAFLGMLTAIVDKAAQFFNPDRSGAAKAQHEGGAKDERDTTLKGLGLDDPRVKDALRKKSSFNDGGGLLHRMAYTDGDDVVPTARAGAASELLSAGVKEGVLAAFREWAAESSAGGIAQSAGGVSLASFGGASGGSGGGGSGGRAGGGGNFDLKGFGGKVQRGKWWTPEHQAHAVDRLMKEGGLSQAGAEGLVSRWANVEAAGGPTSLNRSSGAAGIGQWLGSRKHGFTADYDSQLSHAIDELNHNENGGSATRALRTARNAREAAIGASRFERAEGYNGRSGIDNFTAKSLAGAARVHEEVARAHSEHFETAARAANESRHRGKPLPPVPMPANMPPPEPGIYGPPPTLTEEDRKTRGGPPPVDGSIEAHVHIHDGQVRGATAKSSGAVAPPSVHLRRGPTMTEASLSI